MKKKLFSHPEAIVATLALIFLIILVVFYFWATDAMITQLHRSLVSATPENVSGFDLSGASKLDLRGLSGQPASGDSANVAPAVIPVPVATPVVSPAPTPISTPTPTSTSVIVPLPPVVASTTIVATTTPAVVTSPPQATSTSQ
jgi:hypothetical protein